MCWPAAVREKVRADFRRVAAATPSRISRTSSGSGRPSPCCCGTSSRLRPRRRPPRRGRPWGGHHRPAARRNRCSQTRYLRALTTPTRHLALQKPEMRRRGAEAHRGSAAVRARGEPTTSRPARRGSRRARRPGGRLSRRVPSPISIRRRSGRSAGRAGETLARLPLGRRGADWIAADQPPERRRPRDARRRAGERGRDRLAVALQNARLSKGPERPPAAGSGVGALVDVQESERRRIARELHDEIVQALTGLKLQLEMSVEGAGASTGSGPQLVGSGGLSRCAICLSTSVRRCSTTRPGPALLWHIERYTARTGVRIKLLPRRPARRMPATWRRRVSDLQEGLTTRAARPHHEATVACAARDRHRVRDRGSRVGSIRRHRAEPSSGLSGMRERTTLLGGTPNRFGARVRDHIRASLPSIVPRSGIPFPTSSRGPARVRTGARPAPGPVRA